MSNNEFASEILNKTIAKGADLAEVFISKERSLRIDIINQKLESSDSIASGGIGLRIIKNKRLGFAYTAIQDEFSIDDLCNAAILNSNNTAKDDFLDFPEKLSQVKQINIEDKTAKNVPFSDKLKLALETEKHAYNYSSKVKKTEKASYSESLSEITIANSKGVNISYAKTIFAGSAEVIAEENGLAETGHWFNISTLYSKIDPKKIGETAAKRAVDLLGAKMIKSQKTNIILTPFTASMIFEALSAALSAESVIKGRSLLAGKLTQKIGSINLTLIDDGTLDYGVGSSPYDGEGSPAKETTLLLQGFLSSFLFNCYTAKKMNKKSTGNAVRHSFKTTPEISPTNLYIKNGKTDNLISKVKNGLLVESIIGAHTINPISGDFSIGATGHLIENGKITQPVRGITISGNMIELLNKIADVGSDLEFISNIGSPSLLISDISVSGE